MADEPKVDEVKVEPQEPSPIEVKAQSMGWRGKEHWTGSDEEFIDAAEFVRRKPLFDKIESQKNFYDRKIRDVETTLNQLAQHHTKVKEVEYQRALTDMRHAKREAIKEGDAVGALAITDQMEELYVERQAQVQQANIEAQQLAAQKAPGYSQEFLSWVKTNEWYAKDPEMNGFADGLAAAYIKHAQASGKTINESDVFDHVNTQIRKQYPDKFENPNRDRPGTVSSGDRGGKGSPKPLKTLPPEYEAVARNFEKNDVMSRAEYIKQLTEMGVI